MTVVFGPQKQKSYIWFLATKQPKFGWSLSCSFSTYFDLICWNIFCNWKMAFKTRDFFCNWYCKALCKLVETACLCKNVYFLWFSFWLCSLGRCCDVFVDGSWRGEKLLNLKQIADGAMAICDEKLVLVYCCYTSHWLWCSLTDKLFVINVQICSLCTSTATCRKWHIKNSKNEKALGETQTLRAGCSKAEPKTFTPPQTPSRGHRMTKISSVGDGHYLYLQTQFGEDRCTQFRVMVATDPHTHKQTHRQDRLQYTVPLSLAHSVMINSDSSLPVLMSCRTTKETKHTVWVNSQTGLNQWKHSISENTFKRKQR